MSVEMGLLRRSYTTRRVGEAFKPGHIQLLFRSGRQSIMVWGAVARGRKWPLLLFPSGGLNGSIYADMVIKGRLGKYTEGLKRRIWSPVKVVEDNAPIHNSKVANAMRNKLNIDRLVHPPALPDLNPIENLLAIVESSIAKRFPQATKTAELFEQVQQAWDDIPLETVNRVIDSMEARREAVVASRGIHTRY